MKKPNTYTITHKKKENLELFQTVILEYNKEYPTSKTVYKFDKSNKRFILGILSEEGDDIRHFTPHTLGTLEIVLGEFADWRSDYRGSDGMVHGKPGIPEGWLKIVLVTMPNEMPKLDQIYDEVIE